MMRALFSLVSLLPIAGCAAPMADAGYPSLLPRPIEKRGFEPPAPRVPEPVVADSALDADISRLRAGLEQARETFDARANEAERLARRAGNAVPGSDAWIAAQVVLADLDTLRSGTAAALADVERLAIDRAADGKPPYPALETLLTDAQEQNRAELARIGRIEGMMRSA